MNKLIDAYEKELHAEIRKWSPAINYCMSELEKNPAIYKELDEKTSYLRNGLQEVLSAWGEPFVINQLGSMISVHFSEKPVTDFASAAAANNARFAKYFHAMLERRIYLPPSAFESWFLNKALTKEIIEKINIPSINFDEQVSLINELESKIDIYENTIIEKVDFRTSFNYSIDPEINRIKKLSFL